MALIVADRFDPDGSGTFIGAANTDASCFVVLRIALWTAELIKAYQTVVTLDPWRFLNKILYNDVTQSASDFRNSLPDSNSIEATLS